ncbi:unnamed protein product [Plutella xylostella]|uniref:(diamondback moth) hypothetical protein n=1 Tax=Plutella xylostella TaxID=51655 RepID=A0A8S4EIJ9_PLUXY|nr:unnamed protein product [Plutella xylostella]
MEFDLKSACSLIPVMDGEEATSKKMIDAVEMYAGMLNETDLTISQSDDNPEAYGVLKPLNEKTAIKRFSDGLRSSRLSTIIAARNYSSLSEAIQAAKDEETMSTSSSEVLQFSATYNRVEIQNMINSTQSTEEQELQRTILLRRQKEEMKQTDMKLVMQLDQKVSDQQVTLEKAGVPGFFVTNKPIEIKVQMHLLDFILRLSNMTFQC